MGTQDQAGGGIRRSRSATGPVTVGPHPRGPEKSSPGMSQGCSQHTSVQDAGGAGVLVGARWQGWEPTWEKPQSRPGSRQHGQAGVLGNAKPTPLPLAMWKHFQVRPRLHEGHKSSQLNGICMLGREDPILRKRTWKV